MNDSVGYSNVTGSPSRFYTHATLKENPLTGVEYPYFLSILSSAYTQAIAGLCAIFACCITFHHMFVHLKNYTCHAEQRYIIRILVIVPAFALYSFTSVMLAVHARMHSVFIEPIHDIAEAVAIYCFLALCYQYLGGEGSIMLELNGKTIKYFSSLSLITSCFQTKSCVWNLLLLRETLYDFISSILQSCKSDFVLHYWATLQYTLIKPLTSALSIILLISNKYAVGDFSPTSGYLYFFLINNFTVTLALYGLLLFYFATRDQLRPFKPVLKFVTIKAIIFFSFWQDVLFGILQWSHVVRGSDGYSAGLVAIGCKNVLICIELVFTAIALRYAFPYSIYVLHHTPRLVLDLPLNNQDWYGLGGESAIQSGVDFIPSSTNKLKSLRADLLYGTAAFADQSPSAGDTQLEPSPWDIVESNGPGTDSDGGEQTWWNSQNGTSLRSISASLKATIDPTDIFVDAVHNFHPNYRHYTQTRLDDPS
ncbi:hypothetical protein P879_04790 [Paragonimus westermani]|uniref:Transmembrane protein 184B n=1 Tax=Paragonimus westermani TaxID=34504 RepID=A0A8T0DGH9_9TREM|nr:hypothetical protein P879_04790 [Paragonimus westermani]